MARESSKEARDSPQRAQDRSKAGTPGESRGECVGVQGVSEPWELSGSPGECPGVSGKPFEGPYKALRMAFQGPLQSLLSSLKGPYKVL